MLEWRTSVATLLQIHDAASAVVAVVLVCVVFFSVFTSQESSFFRFDLFNMLLTDMDVENCF